MQDTLTNKTTNVLLRVNMQKNNNCYNQTSLLIGNTTTASFLCCQRNEEKLKTVADNLFIVIVLLTQAITINKHRKDTQKLFKGQLSAIYIWPFYYLKKKKNESVESCK